MKTLWHLEHLQEENESIYLLVSKSYILLKYIHKVNDKFWEWACYKFPCCELISAKKSNFLLWCCTLIWKWVEGHIKDTVLCFWMISAVKCALLHGGKGCCSGSASQLLTWPLLVSPRHPHGLMSSVSSRLVWGCARPLSDHGIVRLQKNVFALPMSYFWMTFGRRGTPCGR